MPSSFPSLVFVLGLAAGCSSGGSASPSDGGPTPPPADAGPSPSAGSCAKQHLGTSADGDAVVFCDALYPERPFVHVPADDTTNLAAVTMYVGLSAKLVATDRTGAPLVLLGADGSPLLAQAELYASPPPQKSPAGLHMLSQRYLFTVYELKGARSRVTLDGEEKDALRVDAARPYILLGGKAIDSAFLGGWEGTASRRIGANEFDEKTRVPIRISLTTLASLGLLGTWGVGTAPLPDSEYFAANGAIENWDKPVKGSDGRCLPALISLGEANPFFGRTGAMRLSRAPFMHAPGDDVTILDDNVDSAPAGDVGMGVNFAFVSPAGLLRERVPADWTALFMAPHGSPTGQRIELVRVDGGGGGGC